MKKTDWVQTFTGRKFYPLEPDIDQIVIEDIAHALSMQCRYSGHTVRFYSVAQHSVIMSLHMFDDFLYDAPRFNLMALLHDASEAYLSDIPRPLKQLPEFEFYRDAEKRLQSMIYERFGVGNLTEAEDIAIKMADREMLAHEASDANLIMATDDWNLPKKTICKSVPLVPWQPRMAELEFLELFRNFTSAMPNQ